MRNYTDKIFQLVMIQFKKKQKPKTNKTSNDLKYSLKRRLIFQLDHPPVFFSANVAFSWV